MFILFLLYLCIFFFFFAARSVGKALWFVVLRLFVLVEDPASLFGFT